MTTFSKKEALDYHSKGRPGKIEVIPTKPYSTQYDLSMAYSPGVAQPCLEIKNNPEDIYKYTAKGNLVAVISNGTAVLGLGNIGAAAGKPVMEGKGLLFKVFSDIDVFDIELDTKDVDKFVDTVKMIAPTFGGINLEDIKAPECFMIEERLKRETDIPVFHDDQHGTAIISAAGLLNALEIIKKNIGDIRVVVNGAGASAISCTRLYISLGVKPENILMLDSKGVLTKKRGDLNEYKQQFAADTELSTLAEAIKGADVFLGLSVGNIVSKEMLQSMADNPIVFAMANPDPEITYEDATDARDDVIIATGRSDYPNQINNVLGFPFIFRGALDVKASKINEEMKKAAVYALADLAKDDVPESVNIAYKTKNLSFGREYIIPKPLDPRLISRVAPAVAKAAINTRVARSKIRDWEAYDISLKKRMGLYNQLLEDIHVKAKSDPKRIAFADAHNYQVLKAVQVVIHEKIATPVLLGDKKEIEKTAHEIGLDLQNIQIVDKDYTGDEKLRERYAEQLFRKRQRKGITYDRALNMMFNCNYFGVMMVDNGDVDGLLTGFNTNYADSLKPALQILGTNNSLNHLAGMYIVRTKQGPFFFADTTVNIQPSGRTIADTALLVANEVRKFNLEPSIAILSYSNFGDIREGSPKRLQEAIEILHHDYPDLIVDGEIQANYAFNRELRMKKFPFSKLADKEVNTVIFPNLSSGNIAYKMMQEIGGAEVIGPVLIGLRKPVQIVQMESSIRDIVNMAAITVLDAQTTSNEIIRF